MSVRAVTLGLFGAVFICATTYINDHVIRQTYLVGSSMPTIVYGMLILLVLVNPLLERVRKGLQFRASELAVIMAITLAVCCIPSAGLMETMPDSLMMPHREALADPAWVQERVVDMAPRKMLADPTVNDGRAITGYVQGIQSQDGRLPVSGVPWSAWFRTLSLWLPIVLGLWLGLLGLSLVMHRRWADHERLPYPIATFASNLLADREGQSVVYTAPFWLGCGVVLLFHSFGYAEAWFPDHVVSFPRRFDFSALEVMFPMLIKGGGHGLFVPKLYFAVLGLAFLLPRQTSFSLGIGPYLYCLFAGFLATTYGVSIGSGGYYEISMKRSIQAGVYAGILCMILYTGRYYYLSVVRSAVGLKTRDPVPATAKWGLRAFMACMLLVAGQLTAGGLDWQLSLVLVLLLAAIFVVIGRICAETGYIFIQPEWNPAVFIVGFLGMRALGPTTALILYLASTILVVDTRESILPFLFNSFKVLDENRVKLKRVMSPIAIALVLGLAVAVPVTLYVKYSEGTDLVYKWASKWVPRMAFDETVRVKRHLEVQGVLAESEAAKGFSRLSRIRPDTTWCLGFLGGLGLLVALSVCHLRLRRWPIHPCMLYLWCTVPGIRFAGTILLACLIKSIVVKYGGERASNLMKPVMIGLIAGDMLFGVISSLIGVIYYLRTGEAPPSFVILVG